jgi:ABC-2 type transport system ATP-binding protein
MKETVVHVKNLKKIYQTRVSKGLFNSEKKDIEAVKDISFDIFGEEVVGFIGPNGAGKTTTLKCLSGLLVPTSGEVEVLGFEPEKRSKEFLRKIALVMGQKSQLWWELAPVETFRLNKEIYCISDKVYNEVVGEMVEVLDIVDVVNKPTRNLSLGERMRCEVVAALLHTPDLVFLDEPTIGLDVVSQHNLREFIKVYNQRYKATVLLTSHNMEDVSNLCKRVIVIDHGVVLYDGRISDLVSGFAKEKYIHFVLRERVDSTKFEDLGSLVECSGNEGRLVVKRGWVSDVAKELLNRFDVMDLDISEPSLEDVIKAIFEGGYKI